MCNDGLMNGTSTHTKSDLKAARQILMDARDRGGEGLHGAWQYVSEQYWDVAFEDHAPALRLDAGEPVGVGGGR